MAGDREDESQEALLFDEYEVAEQRADNHPQGSKTGYEIFKIDVANG